MKIAFILNAFPTLSETFILNQITGLLDLGHNVEIFADSNPRQEKTHPDVVKYNLSQRTHYLPEGRIKLILNTLYLIVTNLHKSPLELLRSLKVVKYRKVALSLRLIHVLVHFLDKNFDIIHCHYGPNGILGVCLKETGVTARVVSTFYGYDLSSFIANNTEDVYGVLFHNGDLFLSISDHFRKRLINLKCNDHKIIVHRLGIDLDKFGFSRKKFRFGDTVKILTIGRLVEKKGFEIALKAFSRLINTHMDVIYMIAGDGPLRSKLETLVSDLAISKYVKFLGPVKQDEVRKLYHQADIFILPSITAINGDQEGTPVVLIECQAMGLPVISSYHSGIPEVIIDGKSGFLVPERDVDALADRLQYLVEHPELWPEMGRCGRKLVEEKYDIKKLNSQLVQIYNALLTDNTALLDELRQRRQD
jgi:colanic acid/amylovoran biosynthesis glycosyltransferase